MHSILGILHPLLVQGFNDVDRPPLMLHCRGGGPTVDFLVLETAGIETDVQIAQFPYAY